MDNLGDRMKMYEKIGLPYRAIPLLPIAVRLDGRAFHSFCKGLDKPYDKGMMQLMQLVTKRLVDETNACIGYTQSDEISLIIYSDNLKSQTYFDGKSQKIISSLASYATYYFNKLVEEFIPSKTGIPAFFDCRAWHLPTLMEASNVLVWREQDATKNSISSAAQSQFSHQALQGKNGSEMQEMLHLVDINWNDYPVEFKRGTYYQRKKVYRKFKTDEIDKLPLKHQARTNPDLKMMRTEVKRLDMPIITRLSNRLDVIFNGDEPEEIRDRNNVAM